jgi:ABC-type uncharacterized transport system involved in gliding motility auxiliary subunit
MIKLNIRNIFSIVRKELKGYFDNPTAYIVIIIFLLLWEFLFFRSAFLVGEASLRILFSFLPWLFLLLVPAITMGSVSQEKSEGTLEFLLTHPLKDEEFLIGKFVAALAFSAVVLLFIFPIAVSFNLFGSIDWGVVFGQYLASVFLASVLIALGILISSLFSSQISSLLVSVTASFFLIIAGFEIVTASLPFFLSSFFERLSVLSHFESMSRGVIDLRDLWYFFSAVFIFLSLAYLQLLKRRFGNRKSLYRSHKIGIALLVGIAILSNAIGSLIPGRIDLTQGRLYTLTTVTKKTLSQLNDVVNITLFASSELPAQLQPVLRDTKDILRDYRIFGKGNIVVAIKNPSGGAEIANQAESLGVSAVRFNVIGREEFQLKQGYLGLAVSYAGEHEAIPFIQDTKDLEYQLTSFIKKLTTTEKKKIKFLSGHGEKSIFSDYRAFSKELEKQFDLDTIDLGTEGDGSGTDSKQSDNPIPEDTAVLVVAGPSQEIDEKTRSSIETYLDNGGTGFFLIDGVSVNPRFLSVFPNTNSFSDFIKTYGVVVEPNLVYDFRSNETVNFGGGFINFLVPYPFWIRALTSDSSQVTARLETVVLPWASSVSLDEAILKEKGLSASILLKTTEFGGTQAGSFSIDPQKRPSQADLSERAVAVSIRNDDNADKQSGIRMIVVGDSDFLTDQFVRNSPENLAFGIEALSWLSQEESLAGIQIKQKTERKLLFKNETQMSLVKYGNLLLAFLLPAGFGLFRLMRRRNLRRLVYSTRL